MNEIQKVEKISFKEKVKTGLISLPVCALALAPSFVAFAEDTPSATTTAITSAATTAASDATSLIASLLPIVLGVVGTVIVVTLGIRLFKRFMKP